MDLGKVKKFNDGVINRTIEIEQLKNKIIVVERMENLQFYTTPANDLKFCSFNLTSDNSDESVKNILEVTKTLTLNALKKQINEKEKELKDFIKKGIADND